MAIMNDLVKDFWFQHLGFVFIVAPVAMQPGPGGPIEVSRGCIAAMKLFTPSCVCDYIHARSVVHGIPIINVAIAAGTRRTC